MRNASDAEILTLAIVLYESAVRCRKEVYTERHEYLETQLHWCKLPDDKKSAWVNEAHRELALMDYRARQETAAQRATDQILDSLPKRRYTKAQKEGFQKYTIRERRMFKEGQMPVIVTPKLPVNEPEALPDINLPHFEE